MKLGNKVTNPGDLRTPITLLKSTVAKVSGGQKPIWVAQAKVKCKWVNAHGSEVVGSASQQAVGRATLTIRFYGPLDASWAVLKGWDDLAEGAEIWQLIAPPDDIRDRHEYMELQVQLIKGTT